MIEGEQVILRPWLETDIPALTVLRNDPVLQGSLLSRARGNSTLQIREWLDKKSRAEDGFFFVISDTNDLRPIGYLQLSKLNLTDKYVELGICLLPAARGKGLGSQAIVLASNYLKANWAVRKVILAVRSDNEAAIKCYTRLGFANCGTHRQHFYFAGEWHDVMLMEKLL